MEKKTNKKSNKSEKTVTATVVAPVAVPVLTESQKIWNEIKDRSIEMFALPNQKVYQYCRPIEIEPSKLYLLISASAVLPSLEAAAGNAFSVEKVDKYVIVSRATSFLTRK